MNTESFKTTESVKTRILETFTEMMLADLVTLYRILSNHAKAIHQTQENISTLENGLNNVAVLSKRAASVAVSKKMSPDQIKKLISSMPPQAI